MHSFSNWKHCLLLAVATLCASCSSTPPEAGPTSGPGLGACLKNDADKPSEVPGHFATEGVSTPELEAEITEVGTGPAPGGCEQARSFEAYGKGEGAWWFRWWGNDGQKWTLGVTGLGATPPVSKGQNVKLRLTYSSPRLGSAAYALLSITTEEGEPLFWMETSTSSDLFSGRGLPPWLGLAEGEKLDSRDDEGCSFTLESHAVTAAINGQSARLLPLSSAVVDGFRVGVGSAERLVSESGPGCVDVSPPSWPVMAAKASPAAPAP